MGILDAPVLDVRGKSLSTFLPQRDIPSTVAWFDASILPGTNGSNVNRWRASYGGFSLNVAPSTKPTLLTGAANGLNAVRFTSNAYLRNADTFGVAGGLNQPDTFPQPYSYAFVFRFSSDFVPNGNAYVLGSPVAMVQIGSYGGGMLTAYAGTNGPVGGASLADGNWHVGIVNFGTKSSTTFVDGYMLSYDGSQSHGTAAQVGFLIGSGLYGPKPSAGTMDIAEVIMTAGTHLTLAQMDLITQNLAKKWGIS